VTENPTRLLADLVIPAEGTGRVIEGGAVDIAPDGRIVGVGTDAELGPATGTVEAVGGLLMPGLVNAHAHTPMTMVRSAGDGLPLQEWLTTAVWPREGRLTEDDVRAGMALGSAEMLLAGVTTSCEMYFHDDAMVDAVRSTGGRMVLTPGVLSVMCPDGDPSGRIQQLVDIHDRHHDVKSTVTVGFAPHSIYDLTPEQVAAVAAAAQDLGVLVHLHLEETERERRDVLAQHGHTATQLLADHGVLDGPVLAAHGVWLDETDQRLLAEAGASVAHCPVSNLKLGSGIAPLTDLRDAGIRVGLGTDGVASNDNLNLWEELKLAPLLARGSRQDPGAIDATTALDLATRGAGEALLVPDIGELRPGAWADVIRLDMDNPAFTPGLTDDLISHVVFAGGASHVTDVWVAGDRVVRSGSLTRVELPTLVHDVRERGRGLLS
jgi:5-methylthioadenosine/S-adenosylhomocysteine deaminase